MVDRSRLVYEFGSFRLDPQQRILVRQGTPVPLASKAFDILLLLVTNRGRVIEKEEMLNALWPESFVDESNLTQHIFILRNTLSDDHNRNAFVQTIPRRGYKFVAPVQEISTVIAHNGARSSLLAEYWNHHSPFRGLKTFEQADAWLFFGRESDTTNLLERIDRPCPLVIAGNSGSGKSSLIRAGLIPALRSGSFQKSVTTPSRWLVALFRPSSAPFDYLAENLSHQLMPEWDLRQQAEFVAYCRSSLQSNPDGLQSAIGVLVNGTPESARSTDILLVVDQFEEIFTLTSDQKCRDRYIDALLAAGRMESTVRVHLVLALRADFYPHCLEHPELSRCLEINLYNLPRMTSQQLRESIEKRFHLAAARAEPGLLDTLLEDVGAEPGNLALLEHALGLLWDQCGGYGCTLSNAAYCEIGRLRGALGRHADEVYARLGVDDRKLLAKKIFLELVQVGEGAQNTRRHVPKEHLLSLGPAEEVEQLLTNLASNRLISISLEGKEFLVEVSHEALIRGWPALCEWLEQNSEELVLERRLLHAAREWEALAHDTGALLQGVRLAQAEEWLARHDNASPSLQGFVQASNKARVETTRREREAKERELVREQELRHQAEQRAEAQNQLRLQQEAGAVEARRSAIRLRWLSCVLVALLLVATWAAVYAYHQQILEKSRSLAAQAQELLPRDHGQALQLAIRSWQVAKTEESHIAMASTFPEQLVALKHAGPVISAAFSPNGERILSASVDLTARLWNSADGRLLATLQGHSREISHAEFSPDGLSIATASYDHTGRVWDGVDGHLLAVLNGHTDKLDWVAFSPDGERIVTASRDRTARVWNRANGNLIVVLEGHTAAVTHAEFSPDGERVITASDDRTARLWNSANGRLLTTISGHTSEIRCVRFFPDERRIITTSGDGTARIWSATDGGLLATLQHDGPVENANFSPDGRFIVTASYDHTARVWSAADGRILLTVRHDGPVQSAGFSRDGRYLITASNDRTARIWNVSNGLLLAILTNPSDAVYSAAFSPQDDRIVTAGGDNAARVWSITTGLTLATLQGHNNYVWDAAFSADMRHIVTASKDHTARVWSGEGDLRATLLGHTGDVNQARFSPDGRNVITAGADGTARIWNVGDGHLRTTLQGHIDKVWSAKFSPDGQRVITASDDGTAKIWSVADGRLLATLRGHTEEVWRAEFSPDGQHAITAGADYTARAWSVADGHLLFTLRGHTGQVNVARFSPDGQRILTASDDHTARVWNAGNGSLLLTLQGHTNAVRAAAFSPDGQRIVTGGLDFTAKIWTAIDGRLLATLRGHSAELRGATFSPDGRLVLTAADDHTARIWNSENGKLLATLQGHTGEIRTASFSADSKRIVTASFDQTARIWRLVKLDDVETLLADKINHSGDTPIGFLPSTH